VRHPRPASKENAYDPTLFGTVDSPFNDFAGHGYHGISVMRSYLGFDVRPISVAGALERYRLAPYYSRLADNHEVRDKTREHGIITFEGGRLGFLHWTNVGYDSPRRWWRSSRFLAEKGMGVTVGVGLDVQERLSLLAPGGVAPRFITVPSPAAKVGQQRRAGLDALEETLDLGVLVRRVVSLVVVGVWRHKGVYARDLGPGILGQAAAHGRDDQRLLALAGGERRYRRTRARVDRAAGRSLKSLLSFWRR
jgi:hypothetical protein